MKFISTLPLQEVGRCLLWLLGPDHFAPIHTDSSLGPLAFEQERNNIVVRASADDFPLFLFDTATGVRHFPTGRAFWFDDYKLHGVNGIPKYTMALRADGIFSEDLKKLTTKRNLKLSTC